MKSLPEQAEAYLLSEAENLLAISDDYRDASKTGKFSNRTIRPEFAKQCAHDFHTRADAIFIIAPLLRKHLQVSS